MTATMILQSIWMTQAWKAAQKQVCSQDVHIHNACFLQPCLKATVSNIVLDGQVEEAQKFVSLKLDIGTLHTERLMPKTGLPPLLRGLSERAPERLQWLGASYGLTQDLFTFWKRSKFQPVYLRQSASNLTGEGNSFLPLRLTLVATSCYLITCDFCKHNGGHAGEFTAIMLLALPSPNVEGVAWLEPFVQDFKLRFLTLLAGPFRGCSPGLALSVLDPKVKFSDAEAQASSEQGLNVLNVDNRPLTMHDLKRLQVCL